MWGPWSPELMGDLNQGKGVIWRRGPQTPFQKMNSPGIVSHQSMHTLTHTHLRLEFQFLPFLDALISAKKKKKVKWSTIDSWDILINES